MRPTKLLAAAAAFCLLTACNGDLFVSDPAGAACDAPPATFGAARALSDHRESDVHFTCEGVTLAGSLYLPNGPGPHPALVWVHGSGQERRLGYGGALASTLVRAGFAVLTYDKRGVGESGGVCCPGDGDHFNLLAADVVGAVNLLRARSDIDARQIGLLGASQAGWIVPIAAVRSGHVAFTALVDAPTVTTGEERLYSEITGDDVGRDRALAKPEIARRLKEAGPSGFDPVPFLRRMSGPGLWLYGAQDRSMPPDESAAVLDRLKATDGKDFTVVVFPNAGHGLLDARPSDPEALPTLVAWLQEHVHVAPAASDGQG